MPFVPTPNIVMVELRCTKAGQKIENRWMFDALTAPTVTILNEIGGIVLNWAMNSYFAWLPEQVSLREVVATDLTLQNGSQQTLIPPEPVNGGRGGGSMPNEVSLAVSLRTGARGRSARGRSYVLGLARADVNENDIGATYTSTIVGIFQDLIDAAATAGRPMVIVSYRNNNAPRPGGPVYFPVNAATLTDTGVDSMRRRKPGVGT